MMDPLSGFVLSTSKIKRTSTLGAWIRSSYTGDVDRASVYIMFKSSTRHPVPDSKRFR